MPFAKKFRAMMDFPFPGDTVGDFTVESVDVHDEWGAPEGYVYGVQMVLRGPGGKQAVQRALKSLFARHPTTFSGYGNPYQLWFRKPEIESLGDQRYMVSVKGSGARIYLEPELARFLNYLDDHHHLAALSDPADREALIETYLDQYRAEIALLVARYHRKLAKSVDGTSRQTISRFPAHEARDVNPDTHLVLTFPGPPTLGTAGQIRIYDAADDRLVDVLDLSIPPGPTVGVQAPASPPYTPVPYEYVPGHFTNANTKPGTPSGVALPTPDTYQLTIIGGFTDAFHFYPVIIHDNVATIYPHNNLLDYDKTYYVQIDPGVLTLDDGSFTGIAGKTGWTFTTKKSPPPAGAERLVVSGDGTGDFNTVQGAIDFIPDHNPARVTIFIKNGVYEEIVYFRNKANITFLGEDRDNVVVCYANNEVFNPHPPNVATNEMPGTFPSRRAAFMGDQVSGIHLVNFTIRSINPKPAQAEGLLLTGEQNIVSHVTIEGSGDALQVNGSAYLTDCRIVGFGDNILGRGPAFFDRCALVSHYGPHVWIRNTDANHGNVFVQCTFETTGDRETVIARSPTNHGKNYPYCEAVLLNCALAGISPEGWGPVGGDPTHVHYWEYNSTNLSDGAPVDVSRRHPASRQLTLEQDAEIIANYSDPTYVLGGWTPALEPLILL